MLSLTSDCSGLPFCSLDFTISCFASDDLEPGFVRLIFILSPLSDVAECSMCILDVDCVLDACAPPCPALVDIRVEDDWPVTSLVFSISASKSIIRSPMPTSHSLSSYSKFVGWFVVEEEIVVVEEEIVGVATLSDFCCCVACPLLDSATLPRWPASCKLDLIGFAVC